MNNGKEEASLLSQSDKVANRVGQTTIRSKRALIKKAPGQSHRDQMVPISAPAILLSRSFVYHHVICLISFLSLSLSLPAMATTRGEKQQKARLARIRMAKATSGAAFLSKKRAVESRLLAQESGLGMDGENGGAGGGDEQHWLREEDIFELQHHHLLRCLEKATVSLPPPTHSVNRQQQSFEPI